MLNKVEVYVFLILHDCTCEFPFIRIYSDLNGRHKHTGTLYLLQTFRYITEVQMPVL